MSGEVHRFYSEVEDEASRLRRDGTGRLEALRTRRLIEPELPSEPSQVLDVGGGTGVHARWIAELGHHVRMIDLVERHVEAARAAGLTAEVADARDLPTDDASTDVVLLLGPLYHLPPEERRIALDEARRVLRPGGLLAAAAISRWAGLLHLAITGPWDDDILEAQRRVLRSGRHEPDLLGFTEAWLHTPAELHAEVEAAGFGDVVVLPVEGPLGHGVDLADDIEDRLDRALAVVELTQDVPELIGASPHLLALARR